jgi:hypothetical protein
MQEHASPIWWGLWFLQRSRKNHKPHAKREREGTWFPHTKFG